MWNNLLSLWNYTFLVTSLICALEMIIIIFVNERTYYLFACYIIRLLNVSYAKRTEFKPRIKKKDFNRIILVDKVYLIET